MFIFCDYFKGVGSGEGACPSAHYCNKVTYQENAFSKCLMTSMGHLKMQVPPDYTSLLNITMDDYQKSYMHS